MRTPNIDQLAAGGLRLTDFHSNGAVCTPTRAALMTGRYPQRCAWVPDDELSPVFRAQRAKNPDQRWAWGIAEEERTLPKLLSAAGYRTALIGKWHLGYDVNFHPMNYGFDEFRGFVGGGIDYHIHIATHGEKIPDWWHDREKKNESGYATDLLTRHAVDFITRNKESPFFLYLAHASPHSPWQGRDPESRKPATEIYKEMIEILDESVGSIVQCLRDTQLEKNTLLIFCSDNGPQGPGGFPATGLLRGKKGTMFEGGHRVPCIASWPSVIPAGKTSGEAVMTMDFLPTFAKLARAELPPGHVIDGADVLPLFKGEEKLPERVLHWKHGEAWAVRQGPWKLMGRGNQPTQLVNLEKDLAETEDLNKENPELSAQLDQLHRRWVGEVGPR